MKNLLAFEFRKLLRTKSFYVCLAVSVIILIANALTSKALADASGGEYVTTQTNFVLGFVSSSMMNMIIGIFTAIYICEDYSAGTIKNVVSKGYSRSQIYFAKYIISLLYTIVFLAVNLLASFIVAKAFFAEAEIPSLFIASILTECVLVFAYLSIYYMISVITNKLGIAIAINIIGPTVITTVLTLIDSALNLKDFYFSQYWIDGLMTSVNNANAELKNIIVALIGGVIIIVASNIAGTIVNSRKEF